MKRLGITLALAVLGIQTSCQMQKHGLVMMTDESYRPRVLATSKMGFGSPDGLLLRNGKFYIADEGSDTVESWSPADGLKQLAGARLGFLSPEDLIMDRDGNIF